ncbi:hypothetical protein ACQP1V_00085 [Microtetraspora malaysiensis]
MIRTGARIRSRVPAGQARAIEADRTFENTQGGAPVRLDLRESVRRPPD